MKRWSEEEIKGHLTRLECNRVTILTMDSLAIIQQLQADLAECRKEVARECAEMIVHDSKYYGVKEDPLIISYSGTIAKAIRHKYGIGG